MKFLWLKHYFPRGIYARAALILLLPVVVVQIVVLVVFVQRHFEDVTQQMSDTVIRELQLLLAADPERIKEIAGPLEMLVVQREATALTDPDSRLWYDFSGLVIIDRLSAALPQIAVFDLYDDDVVRLVVDDPRGPFDITFDNASSFVVAAAFISVLPMLASLRCSGERPKLSLTSFSISFIFIVFLVHIFITFVRNLTYTIEEGPQVIGWDQKADIYCRNYVENFASEHKLLIVGVVALWIRCIQFVAFNEYLGRFLGVVKRLISETVLFFVLYIINLIAFSFLAEAAFREMNEFNTKSEAFITLFYASFGTFDFER